jgi:formate hydrogenlyase subunit 3/multisubunit Na+/H+ antiporter MnhD subunit
VTENKKESVTRMYRPLLAMVLFVILAGASGSQVLYAIKELSTHFDILWLIQFIVFGFLLILSFVVLLAIVYALDRSQGRIKRRVAFIEGFFGDNDE